MVRDGLTFRRGFEHASVSMTGGANDARIVWEAGAGALAPPPPRLKTTDDAARTPAAALLATVLLAAGQPQPVVAATAVWAGGCFWCMEQAFEAVPGVEATVAGYSGGELVPPDPGASARRNRAQRRAATGVHGGTVRSRNAIDPLLPESARRLAARRLPAGSPWLSGRSRPRFELKQGVDGPVVGILSAPPGGD